MAAIVDIQLDDAPSTLKLNWQNSDIRDWKWKRWNDNQIIQEGIELTG